MYFKFRISPQTSYSKYDASRCNRNLQSIIITPLPHTESCFKLRSINYSHATLLPVRMLYWPLERILSTAVQSRSRRGIITNDTGVLTCWSWCGSEYNGGGGAFIYIFVLIFLQTQRCAASRALQRTNDYKYLPYKYLCFYVRSIYDPLDDDNVMFLVRVLLP